MQYNKLGNSSLEVSSIGFGTMSLKPGNESARKLVDKAIGYGINFFDTADLYDKGENEILVGNAIKDHRRKLILATKVGNEWDADGKAWSWNPKKEYILKAVDKSLQRLQTDYIDLYQLHGGTIDDPIEETIDAFETLVRQGKIRYYGISSIRPNVIRKWVAVSNMTTVMMQYSLLDRRPEESCLDLLSEKNIGVLARGSIAQGLLIDKPARPYLEYAEEDVKKMVDAVQQIADKTAVQTSVQYVLSNRAISSAIVGIRTMEQLEEVVKATDTTFLKEKELKMLKETLPINIYKEHR
jgi:aryl-alcohol dehydrogenase-like predicted oxidoreductase